MELFLIVSSDKSYSDYCLLQHFHLSFQGNLDSTNVRTALIVNFKHFLAV